MKGWIQGDEYPDEFESEFDTSDEEWDEDTPAGGDLNQCPECGDNLDFSNGKGFCWSCDI